MLKKFLCEPKVKKVDLHFPLGLEVTARNLKGVTIKDALDAIHKQFKKKVRYIPLQSSRLTCGVTPKKTGVHLCAANAYPSLCMNDG